MNFLTNLLIAILASFSGLFIGVFYGIYIAYVYEKDTGKSLFNFKDKEEGEN